MTTLATARPFAPIKKRSIIAVGALFATLALCAAWWWGSRSEGEAVSDLPVDERGALYERTLKTLQETCALVERPKGLDAYCSRQTKFILKFPECDRACADLARQQATPPSR